MNGGIGVIGVGGVGSGYKSARAGTPVPLLLPVTASASAAASAADVVRDVEEALIDAAKEVSTLLVMFVCVRADM